VIARRSRATTGQLGHANPNITLGTYAQLYARADHATTARAALDASYAAIAGGT